MAFFQLAAYRNLDLSAVVPAAQLELARTQVSIYWSAQWYETLLGALERFFTIPVQITFSVIVLQTFTRKQGYWVWLAVFYHALIDASAVFLAPILGVLATAALIGCFALFSLWLLFGLRQPEPAGIILTQPEETVATSELEPLKPVAETPENLDNSIYQ